MAAQPPPDPHAATRAHMVADQLAARGIRDERVLAAMRQVPRERFVPDDLRGRAYDDAALPIECQQTISQPFMVACMTAALQLTGPERVLEIGTGSGYQTAVLARLAARVYTVEWHLLLSNQAAARLADLDHRHIVFRCGDGSLGWPEHAPYDAILVTAGAPQIPAQLPAQLADGGRLVVPVGDEHEQALVRIVRRGERFERETGLACRFVKLVGQDGWRVG